MASTPDVDDDTKQLLIQRQRAREAKDWAISDQLRDELLERGVMLNDIPSGVSWRYNS